MRIYSMTATFGKLEHETLTLNPGLNIIEAPNEWGKSTWCAFLAAMLYGLDTRAKSTKTALADKERYAPWSGSPMAGRMDLNWNGRDITIERSTRGRVPLGEFRAYETQSGLAVPELTAANCGQLLLGVERSVFLRSGFIRFSDLPVSNDEALRRRLNALVTTGDENGAASRLAKGLKELKNRCRYNRTGLIPQAEGERARLEGQLQEIETLEAQRESLGKRLEEVEQWLAQLENHKAALAFDAAQMDAQRVAQARQLRDEAAERLKELNEQCAELPEREQIRWMLDKICKLDQEIQALQMEEQLVRLEVQSIEKPEFIGDLTGEEALGQARTDGERYASLKRKCPIWIILALLLAAAGGMAAYWYPLPGLIGAAAGIIWLAILLILSGRRKQAAKALEDRYGSDDPDAWIAAAERYLTDLKKVREIARQQAEVKADIKARAEQLEEKILRITQGKGLRQCRTDWESALQTWDARTDAGRDYQKAQNHLQALEAMARPAAAPAMPDKLSHSEADTARLLSDGYAERVQLQNRLSQYAGRMEALGDKSALKKQLHQVNARIGKLEETYEALVLAQETLAQAAAELQRRFAPRISKRAGEWMAALTNGRYDRVQLAEDLSLLAGAEGEDTLHEVLWRSDGTVDQLYLALRLAVAEALMPDGPLILDDALVRFDDTRLKAALQILKSEGAHRQVILFSCQSREKRLLE